MAYKSKPMRKRYGYMGTSSWLNGLTSWIQEKIHLKGDAFHTVDTHYRYQQAIEIINQYGDKNIPGFHRHSDLNVSAEFVAKWINNDLRVSGFLKFTQWVFKHYPKNK